MPPNATAQPPFTIQETNVMAHSFCMSASFNGVGHALLTPSL
jgi:hypothetical protein